MKNKLIFLSLLLFGCSSLNDLNYDKQIASYIMSNYDSEYKYVSSGEMSPIVQTELITEYFDSKIPVTFVKNHVYSLGDNMVMDNLFYFDENKNLIGHLKGSFRDSLYNEKSEHKEEPNVDVLLVLVLQKLDNGDYEEALKLANEAIEKNPYNRLAYWNRGKCYRLLEKHDLACSDFTKAKELYYENSELYNELQKCK